MNKLLLLFLFVVNSFFLRAQTVNGTPLNDINEEYIQIELVNGTFTTKLYIEVDFGQKTTFFSNGEENFIQNSNNEPIEFNSIADALNFMYKNGYEYVNVYTIRYNKDRSLTYYLLKKRKMKLE